MSQKKVKIFSTIAILLFLIFELLGIAVFDALSYAAALAGLAAVLYDNFLWKYNPFEKNPKIFGIYEAQCHSMHNGGTDYKSTVVIKQTLSSISVIEMLDGACCESVAASLTQHTPNGPWFLYYTYLTHPKPSRTDDMHYGSGIFHVRNSGLIEGSYFTNRIEQTAGTMTLIKIES